MQRTNVEVIRELYDAFARGDVHAVLGRMDAGIEWIEAENFIYADNNPYVGPDAVAQGVFGRIHDEWDGFGATAEEYHDAGETIITRGRYDGRYKSTGRSIHAQFVHVWWLRDGKVTRFQQYVDTLQVARATAQE